MIEDMLSIRFSDIAESLEFPRFCKILAELLDFHAFALKELGVDGYGKMLSVKGLNPLCKFIQQDKNGSQKCSECDRIHIEKVCETKKSIQYICHAGLRDFVTPIVLNNKVVAVFEGGQFLTELPSERGFSRLQSKLKELNLDQKILRELYFKSPFISKKKLGSIIELISFFSDYLCECLKYTNKIYKKKSHFAILEACVYIREHYKNEISLDDIAEHVSLTPTYLSRLFKEKMEMNIIEYIQSIRISEAKSLLKKTQLPVTQIAFRVGFQALSHFYRVFHKSEKRAPREYRKIFQVV